MTPQNLSPINGRILLKVIEDITQEKYSGELATLNTNIGHDASKVAEIMVLPIDADVAPLKIGDIVLYNRNAGSVHYFDYFKKVEYRLLKKDDIYGIITPDSSSDEGQEDN